MELVEVEDHMFSSVFQSVSGWISDCGLSCDGCEVIGEALSDI